MHNTSMKDDAKETAEIIAELIAITGTNQYVLAKIAGVTQPTVGRWARGTSQPVKTHWDRVIAFAASDPATVHLAHRYVLSLIGNKYSDIMGLIGAAGAAGHKNSKAS